jgi:hypothetical protein
MNWHSVWDCDIALTLLFLVMGGEGTVRFPLYIGVVPLVGLGTCGWYINPVEETG